jgi:hypothetical protein
MRWAFYNRLREEYPNACTAYGYITNTRIRNGLEKDHAVDTWCTGGNPLAVPLNAIYMQKTVRKRNRQLYKATINKGGKRKLDQAPKMYSAINCLNAWKKKRLHFWMASRREL